VHIHDLKGSDKNRNGGWYARIEVQIRDQAGENQSGVLVAGRFSGAYSELVTGTTGRRGKVVFESATIGDDDPSVTFTVVGLEHPDYVYAPEDNRRGPSVTVEND
jgi:hypothetical protein